MKVYVVMGGNYYEGHEAHTLQVFPDTHQGKVAADIYADHLQDGVEGRYDRVYMELVEVQNAV